jgi:outer membrane protein assembly factor BamB
MRTSLYLAAVVLLNTLATSSHGQHWPQFRGAQGNGVAETGSLPAEWNADRHVAWKTAVPGVGWSQPVVWGERIFLTTAITANPKKPNPKDMSPGGAFGGLSFLLGPSGRPPNRDYQWKVLCLDAGSGEVVWDQTAREGRPTIPVHFNNTYATETPATDGERLIAYFGMTGLYCYDLAGKLLWSKELGVFPTQFDWGTASSPIIFGEAVFVQCDNDKASFLVALDKRTGDELWRAKRDERSNWSTPYVWKNKQRTELVAAGGTKMRSYDPASGELLWEMAASGRTATTPVGDDDLLYVDSYDRLTGNRGVLAAVRPGASGDISLPPNAATSDSIAWSANLTNTRVASPLLSGGCLYLLQEMAGIVRCLDAKTGKEHYRQRLPGAAGFTASPWASGNKVFCLDQDGQTFVLAAGPEFKLLATNVLGPDMFWSSPAAVDRALFLRGMDHLYCIRQETPDGGPKK